MIKYKNYVSWFVMMAFMITIMLPVTPAYAFSVSDLFQATDLNSSKAENDMSTGKGILDVFLGLLLGKLLGSTGNTLTQAGITDNSGSDGQSSKEFVGFYAEWWGTDTASFDSMINNANVIKTIAPFWATLQADGTVTDRGGNDHATVVSTAQQKNMTVLLLINNAKQDGAVPPVHTVLSSPALRTKAIDNFEAYIKKYNLDGINVDFEMVPAEDRDNLTAFMKELSERLKPQGYIVSIDVFPKQNEDNDVAAAYDYAALAKYADKIMIMTYDNHGVWSGPGPIADIRWVENNLKYALRFIPKNKLYLGIAAYGYDWSAQGTQSLDFKSITDLSKRYGQAVQWDDMSKSPYFSYTAADGVAHTVWFENSESIKFKLSLITKYDIAGAAMWKLGEEDPKVWSVLRDTFHK
ncbi:glycosyl hydrolase family 18 protein [Sporomusa acidovorans]|uniref:GH18 domain-containing protein n=1 Tax=Sporomusa acidovorans (strain ATCC 49682 / DSM 3132 / Mol) TaxID=1123286 RepID=A0ABZ3J2L9_SPOA4|nr:glycosyl hydrolase family 18 protein [Sporomusa acidovorans]OZC20119.1 putative sporulation-specific glycosylase YdhD [Sporomusa acidovorans DSM 3132]SDD44564.1 Spore germination protein YaaH [Sporomusa acidovorans]